MRSNHTLLRRMYRKVLPIRGEPISAHRPLTSSLLALVPLLPLLLVGVFAQGCCHTVADEPLQRLARLPEMPCRLNPVAAVVHLLASDLHARLEGQEIG